MESYQAVSTYAVWTQMGEAAQQTRGEHTMASGTREAHALALESFFLEF